MSVITQSLPSNHSTTLEDQRSSLRRTHLRGKNLNFHLEYESDPNLRHCKAMIVDSSDEGLGLILFTSEAVKPDQFGYLETPTRNWIKAQVAWVTDSGDDLPETMSLKRVGIRYLK